MKKAFTLIELLVVIAIIAILAAILFPVFAQAKAAAKKTAALSNLKQNGTAVLMYTADYDGSFAQSAYATNMPNGIVQPGARVFSMFDAMLPYTKNRDIYMDSAAPEAIKWQELLARIGMTPDGAIRLASFAPNFALFEDPAVAPNLFDADPVINEGQLDVPADTSMFFTARYIFAGVVNMDAPSTSPYYQPTGPFSAVNFPGTARHNETLIINFADGHAKSYSKKGSIPGEARRGYGAAETEITKVYNLPYDVAGIPSLVGDPRP